MPMSKAFQAPPTIMPTVDGAVSGYSDSADLSVASGHVGNHLKVQLLVRAYQARGHHKARIDPLGIRLEAKQFGYSKPKELELETYGFNESSMEDEYELGPGILPRFKTEQRSKMKLREIVETCERLYCGSYGVEYINIPDREQ